MGYSGAGTSAPYTDQVSSLLQLSSGATAVTAAANLASGSLTGKQRNTFGAYSFQNANLQSINIDKLTSSGLSTVYTTAADSAVELLGAHEFYYWGWGQQLLAKLSDGISFKMYQVRGDVDAVAATGTPAPVDADRIEQGFKLLWHVPDKTIIPPVFVQDVGVFFVVDQSSVGWL